MTAPNKLTPEEKLLHIIENTKVAGQDNNLSGSVKKGFHMPSLNLGSLSSIVRSLKINPKHLSLRDANKVLIVFSVFVTIFAFFYIAKESKFVQQKMSELRNMDIKQEPLSIDMSNSGRPNESSYIAGTLKNNPFHLLPTTDEVVEKKEVETIDLNLVGILWSDSAQAIIEDVTANQTYMVYEGDSIENYKVVQITQSEVKLVSEFGEKILQ